MITLIELVTLVTLVTPVKTSRKRFQREGSALEQRCVEHIDGARVCEELA